MDITLHEFCSEAGITEAQFYGKEKINGSIDLRSLTSIPDGFNPTVGGELILYSLITIPDGFKFQATDKEGIYKGNIDEPMVLSWQNGRYRLIDGMFMVCFVNSYPHTKV